MSFWESLSSLDDEDVEELLSRNKPTKLTSTKTQKNGQQRRETQELAESSAGCNIPGINLTQSVVPKTKITNGSRKDPFDINSIREDSFLWDSFDDISDLEEEFLKTRDATDNLSGKVTLRSIHSTCPKFKNQSSGANALEIRNRLDCNMLSVKIDANMQNTPKILLRSIHNPSSSPTKLELTSYYNNLLPKSQDSIYKNFSIVASKVVIHKSTKKYSSRSKSKSNEANRNNLNCKKESAESNIDKIPYSNETSGENYLKKIQIQKNVQEELDNIADDDNDSLCSFKTLSDDNIPEIIENSSEKPDLRLKMFDKIDLKNLEYNNEPEKSILSIVSHSDPTSPLFHRYATTSCYQKVDKRHRYSSNKTNRSFAEVKYETNGIVTPSKRDSKLIINEPSFESPQIISKTTSHVPKIIDSFESQESTSLSQRDIVLSEEQNQVLQIIKSGHNVFYTGSAGTGKSVLLKELINQLREKYNLGQVAVCASTGLAACNIGGITVHSFSGIGIGVGEVKKLIQKVRRNKKSIERWKNVKVWIIDEISMIDGNLLDKLDKVARTIRKVEAPFGGIQVVFCGDFYQLPPVVKNNYYKKNEQKNNNVIYAFESKSWKEAVKIQVVLSKVFRQQTDLEFIEMLNEMRNGRLSEQTISNFMKLSRPLSGSDGLEAAELFSTRREVENANNIRLKVLPNLEYVFNSIDGGSLTDQDAKEKILSNFLSPKQLILKKNCQVMIIKNMAAENLVNGSLGRVLTFIDKYTLSFYHNIIDLYSDEFSNAGTINKMADNLINVVLINANKKSHKSTSQPRRKFNFTNQPTSMKEKDSNKKEDDTKSRTLLEINCYNETNFDKSIDEEVFDIFRIKCENPTITEQERLYIETIRIALNKVYIAFIKFRLPYVRFLGEDGVLFNRLISPESWKIEDENEVTLVERVQLPLMLAWALSIHKSQGQTLTKVKVDLRRVFEKGQAYVAISRATSRKGLQVLNFNPLKVIYDVKVEQFYKGLMNVESAILKADELASHPAFISRKFFSSEPPSKRQKKM